MKKTILIIVISLIIILVGYFAFFQSERIWTKEQIANSKVTINISGSGYPDLEGKSINYKYVDFGGFKLVFYDNKLLWEGFEGYFDGVKAKVKPQISRVNNDIYFLSWVFPNGGGDNVVVNFKSKKVYAHLHQTGAERPTPFEIIHGDIICGPSTDCDFPEGKTSGVLSMISKLKSNTEKFNLPESGTMNRPLIEENYAVRDELKDQIIKYKTENGMISIQIIGEITRITNEEGTTKDYPTQATKIDDGVYFISWLANENFGEHIIFNQNTNQVFDQILSDGTSKERIYKSV